jgi:integrase
MEKITTRAMQRARSDAKRSKVAVMLWDQELQGFGLRASPKGRVSWFIEKWSGGRGGRAKRVVIGHSPPLDLEEARREAGAKINQHWNGVDLVSEKKAKREAKRKELQSSKLSDLVSLYLKRKSKKHSQGYKEELSQMFQGIILPHLGKDTRIIELSRDSIKSLIDAKLNEDKQAMARYLYASLNPFMNWCQAEGYIASSPMNTIPKPETIKPRDRALSKQEIKLFWKAATKMGYPWSPFYRLLLLTAQRREEVASMEWTELDQGIWVIPSSKTKNGREHIVHLSPLALETIATVPKGARYLFTTTGRSHVSGFAKAKARLDKELRKDNPGFAEWRTHDLRRTAKTGMASLGILPDISERVLNHVQKGLDAVYNKYQYLPERKEALAKWGEYIQELTGP